MKAMLKDRVIAASDDVLEYDNYRYFRRADVRMEWLKPADKTESDRACPHGVRFYDVVIDKQTANKQGTQNKQRTNRGQTTVSSLLYPINRGLNIFKKA